MGVNVDDLTKRVARLVRNYIEHVWPQLEKRGGVPDTPMNRKERGRSSPAIVWRGLGIVDANLIASKYMRWAIDDTVELYDEEGRSVVCEGGISMAEVLLAAGYNPGLIPMWEAADDDEARRWKLAFWDACRRLAQGVLFRFATTQAGHDELMRRLELDYDDPAAFVVRRAPEDEIETRGRTRNGQKIDTMHTRRLMVEQLEQLEASTDYRGDAAIEILAERKQKEGKDWTFFKIRDAKTAVNRERREQAGEVA